MICMTAAKKFTARQLPSLLMLADLCGLDHHKVDSKTHQFAPASLRATVLGLHATVVGVGLLPASLLAGLLWDWLGAPAAFLVGSAAGLLAAAGLAALLRPSRAAEPEIADR